MDNKYNYFWNGLVNAICKPRTLGALNLHGARLTNKACILILVVQLGTVDMATYRTINRPQMIGFGLYF